MWQRGLLIVMCGLATLGCARRQTASPEEGLLVVSDIAARRAQFVEQELSADLSHLSPQMNPVLVEDSLEALVALGYRKQNAKVALEKVFKNELFVSHIR